MTIRDVEVIELLADEPELLAIADAVSATQRKATAPKRRGVLVRGAILLAAAIAAIVAALALPQGHSEGVVGRALAAVGRGPIMHLVTEQSSGTVYIDLSTGHRTTPVFWEELWVDRAGDRLHVVLSENGRVLGDLLLPQDATSGATSSPPNPAFVALWTGYRAALKNGTAKLVGRGVVRGRPVYWLRFEPAPESASVPHPPVTQVAVDVHTYKPVLFRTHSNGRHFDVRILLAKAIPYRPAEFKRRGPKLFGSVGGGGSSSGGSSSGASGLSSVPAPWLTAGPTVAGLRLRNITRFSEFTVLAHGRRRSAHGIELVYGPVAYGGATASSTTVDELLRPDDPQVWKEIPAGSIRVESGGETSSGKGGEHQLWTGYLVKDGVHLTLSTTRGERVLLEIARALHPGHK